MKIQNFLFLVKQKIDVKLTKDRFLKNKDYKMKTKESGFYFLIGILLLFGVAVYRMFAPFIIALVTAFVLWQLLEPMFERTVSVVRNRRLASLMSCLVIVALVIVPLAFVGTIATKEAINLYQNSDYEAGSVLDFEKKIIDFVARNFVINGLTDGQSIDSIGSELNLGEIAKKGLEIGMNLLKFGYEQTTQILFMTFIMLFVLYYLFLEGNNFVAYIFRLSPLNDREENMLWSKMLSMTKATIKGTLFIGLIQGVMGGISFWTLGVGAPFLLGVIMAIFSALPLIGPIAVWLPVVIWLLVGGETVKALILLFIGSLVIGSVDNLLRPKLVGKETALHPIWVLIGTLGGIMQFGIMGFVIGPVIMTIFIALLEMFEKKIKNKRLNPS